ncbi:MAG TPA: formyltetrahydrofolate deformylase [Candidatus Omnitrophica bacterium]|nr:MAG: formyltetrahydrofolate deformylase [Omnitrophica WOR_2 bacterium GWA2_45_18]OGX20629.1 MAG: formyltetrahydrofolate deformylase [Omnitrophica WOR_2 bacterium GWC2_45_7]HBR15327.1 formyltetrahydrofolate deformylase [Candidatus Omnitrophota bacterium]
MNCAILLISCPDQKGITASVANFVFQSNGNIVHADQHIDEQANTFFMRIEWTLTDFSLSREEIARAFSPIAEKFGMKWDLFFTDKSLKIAIFVSRHLHCLHDLLYRQRAGHIVCDMPLIISNHPDARGMAREFGIDFHEIPILRENKEEQERRQLEILEAKGIDLIVLARYHQILTKQFVDVFADKIINIHHSFLPAFAGRNPYSQAYQKGVKIIGATSHYVTEALDEGPIIEQDTVRISHRDALSDLVRKGEDLEKIVLSRAVRLYVQRKILRYGNKTVIFD